MKNNYVQNALQIVEHVSSGNAQRIESGARELSVPPNMARGTIPHRMRLPIDFDRESSFETAEIHHIPSVRELTPKSEAAGTLAKLLPQQHFG